MAGKKQSARWETSAKGVAGGGIQKMFIKLNIFFFLNHKSLCLPGVNSCIYFTWAGWELRTRVQHHHSLLNPEKSQETTRILSFWGFWSLCQALATPASTSSEGLGRASSPSAHPAPSPAGFCIPSTKTQEFLHKKPKKILLLNIPEEREDWTTYSPLAPHPCSFHWHFCCP